MERKDQSMNEKDESKDRQSQVSTCFDGFPCAEMMQKIMDDHEVGSLCEEAMKTWLKNDSEGKAAPQGTDKEKNPNNGGAK